MEVLYFSDRIRFHLPKHFNEQNLTMQVKLTIFT
jgi:hypothetical protein